MKYLWKQRPFVRTFAFAIVIIESSLLWPDAQRALIIYERWWWSVLSQDVLWSFVLHNVLIYTEWPNMAQSLGYCRIHDARSLSLSLCVCLCVSEQITYYIFIYSWKHFALSRGHFFSVTARSFHRHIANRYKTLSLKGHIAIQDPSQMK